MEEVGRVDGRETLLTHTRNGNLNYVNLRDIVILVVGTLPFGI